MVLNRLAVALPLGMALMATSAHAQKIETTAPALNLPDGGDQATGIKEGPFVLLPSGEARIEYDSNVYAARSNRIDDFVAIVTPRIEARYSGRQTQASVRGEARLRRFFKVSSENSTDGLVDAKVQTFLSSTDRLTADVSWRRASEDRGDPEARQTQSTSPRQFDMFAGEIGWNHQGGRIDFSLQGTASRINYLSAIDDDRDLDIFVGRASASYQISGSVRAVAIGFINQRDFRLAKDYSGINRDATTYGARAGLRFGDTGFLRGEATVGIFHLSPKDPTLPGHNGVSVEAALAYLPRRRLAITLDAFRGDVASVRSGAQSRTDTKVQLGAQVEARHNFRLQGALFYRRYDYRGSSISEKTKGVMGEAEYRLNRYVSIAASALYTDRNSDIPSNNFERLRTAIELRMRF